jgi:hypothetical protein
LCVCVPKCQSGFLSGSFMIVCLLFVVIVIFRRKLLLSLKNNAAHTHIKDCLIYLIF